MSKKYNQLNSDQRYDLWRWVEQNTESVQEDTDMQTATKASEVLRFSVTEANIVAAREKFGIKKSGGRPASAKLAELERRIAWLEARFGELQR